MEKSYISVQVNGEEPKSLSVAKGTSAFECLVEAIGKSKAKKALFVEIDGELRDLSSPIEEDVELEPVFYGDERALEHFRHSCAHLLAQAVKELFPDAKLAIGPATDSGFYYDFDCERAFTPEDLKEIEKRMKALAKRAIVINRKVLGIDEAIEFFKDRGEDYKVELLQELKEQGESQVSIYEQNEFVDLCRGPHVPHTGHIKVFKLTSLAGAYWRGDEKNPMLQRVYGTAFFSKEELKEYLDRLEEAKKRDHRKLGKELELFSISDEIGPGLILWHPKGALMRKLIEDFWRNEHLSRGYELLFTPHIARRDLWKTSGHLDFYAENMYSPMEIDGVTYQIKPMNCPFHIALYNSRRRSYREFPIRWCELGTVYRYERTGTLHGLMRVRGFTQDDAHLFIRPDQLDEEIKAVLDMTLYMLRVFGFNKYDVYLSTRPEKFVGTEENWERATSALENALKDMGLPYEEDPGEGVFYGPKIDIKIRDCLDRSWQCSTIQVDFNLPERFNVKYIGEDGAPHTPIMVHRALLGSLERFFGVLIEHYGGAFPVWLSPVQAIVLTVTERHNPWAEEVKEALTKAGIRAEADLRNEKLGKKIREAQLRKIPYMLIVGDKEVESKTVSPRTRDGVEHDPSDLDSLVKLIKEEEQRPFKEAILQ
ncbi:Threonyl-tRNA synthetase [Dissulfuribacter thermophilus]|uniref:Threonine--tRNA ligase n=1 Tax=Dissulfuribacter thermophilus TaxID=1156395 RepID=A0A1B9F3K9_9BACT|nr:threonine--tRNA ligase [Dissulfuribacter thermophilus]OCC14516.1 Threonyl-tRNA synthetase [Dissulfuribacter thermophilus]